MKLYSYWRSTTSYRVRIALALKGLPYETVEVNLVDGAQNAVDYVKLNPSRSVPTLVTQTGIVLTQSLAILEWLEECYPKPSLLPQDDAKLRAYVRAAALVIATDMHPVNNLRVVKAIKELGHDEAECTAWMNDWTTRGFMAFQSMIRQDTPYCFGKTPGLTDLCLIPQLYNAHRWGCDMTPFTRLRDIEARCLAHPAFDAARPETQPDAA
jgi:maleylacetoacetate isomerase